MDTELFFPSKGNNEQTQEAKAVCYGCTVREDCLEEALSFEANKDFGILGGLTKDERASIRRRRQRAQIKMARYANYSARGEL
jgi:WhiB family redox-sensing transcriptional regulator